MKKLFTVICLAFLCSSTIFAQKKSNEPKEELYVFEYQSNEVSAGYGFAPAMQWIGGFDNILLDKTIGSSSTWGAVNISYLYRPYEYLTFGGSYSFTGLRREIVFNNRYVGELIGNIHVIMPVLKSNWYKNNILTLYSKVAAGVAIGMLDYQTDGTKASATEVEFAFQASPLGVEIGRKVAFFAEFGFGYQGTVIAGIRCKF